MGISRRTVAVVVASAFAVGLALLACSTFSEESEPVSTEAGSDSSADSSADAGMDRDSSATADADADAAPTGPFCDATPSAFCDDFDDPGSSQWTDDDINDGGVLVVTDASAVSPPGALRASVLPPLDGGPCTYSLRTAVVDIPAPNGFSADFKILPGGPNGMLPAEVVVGLSVQAVDSMGQACDYYLSIGPTSSHLYTESLGGSDGGSASAQVKRAFAPGVWNTVTIQFSGAPGATRTVQVKVNGVDGITPAAAVIPFCRGATRVIGVDLGLHCIDYRVPGPVEAWFDDVRVRVP